MRVFNLSFAHTKFGLVRMNQVKEGGGGVAGVGALSTSDLSECLKILVWIGLIYCTSLQKY